MGVKEILTVLPKLTPKERREIERKIFELEGDRADLERCDQSALQGFQALDRLEEKDAARPTR
jgi:hypothetical protein